MATLNIDTNYFNHFKTKRLIGRLGKGAEVLPLRLWAYCGETHPENGRLAGYSATEIESIVGWWGKDGELIDALLNCGNPEHVGFLEKIENGYQCHDWLEYQGHLAAFKIRAKKGANARWNKLAGQSMLNEETSNASSNAVSNPLTNYLTNVQTVPTINQISENGKPIWEKVIQDEWKIPFTKIPAQMLRDIVDLAKKHGDAETLSAIQKTGKIKDPNIYYLSAILNGTGKKPLKSDPPMVRKKNYCSDCKREIPESFGLVCPQCEDKRREKEIVKAENQAPDEIQREISESLGNGK